MSPFRRFLNWYRSLLLCDQLVPLAAIGFLYATAVIWYGHRWFHLHVVHIDETCAARSQAFLTSGKSVLWFLLVAVESAVWFAVAAAYSRAEPEPEVTTTKEWFTRWPPRIIRYVLVVTCFFLPLLYSNLFTSLTVSEISPLIWHGQKMLWLAVPAVTAVVCVIARLRDIEHAAVELLTGDIPTRVAIYLDRQERLRVALGVLGLMLSLNVLTTGALRNTLSDVLKAPDRQGLFDVEMVLAFGGAYTFLVIAFYAPVYFSLTSAGRTISYDAANPPPPVTPATPPAELLTRLESQDKWDKALGLERDWLKSLQAGLVLLSPFFAALVSLLLPSNR
jgi:hypothetical protein